MRRTRTRFSYLALGAGTALGSQTDARSIRIYVWDAETGEIIKQFGGDGLKAIHPDERHFLGKVASAHVMGTTGRERFFETNVWKTRFEWPYEETMIGLTCATFTPDGRHVVAAAANGTIYIFRPTLPKPVAPTRRLK